MKVLRAVAGVHFGKFSFGSLDLPQSRVCLSGPARGIRTKENPRGGRAITLEETVKLRGHLCRM